MAIEEKIFKKWGSTVTQFLNAKTGAVYKRIFCGLGWPYADRPGFIVVLAEDYDQDHGIPHSPRHYRLLAEYESFSVEELYQHCMRFRDGFCFSRVLANEENPLFAVWWKAGTEQANRGTTRVNLSRPACFEKIDPNVVLQLVKRNTETRKTLHFENSSLPGLLMKFTSEDIEGEQLEHYPSMTALGFVLGELEMTGSSLTRSFHPNRKRRPKIGTW